MKFTLADLKKQLADPDGQWQQLIDRLQVDLEAHAKQYGALCRRRHIQHAGGLLRLILMYSLGDLSLQLSGVWAKLLQVGDLNKNAVNYRVRSSANWLSALIVQLLLQRQIHFPHLPGVRVQLRDATGVSRPGSQGTDWRVHVSVDLGTLQVGGITVTDAHGGESLDRFEAPAGEIVVADQGYAHPKSLGSLLQRAYGVIRFYWRNLRLVDVHGHKWDVATWITQLSLAPGAQGECTVFLPIPHGRLPVRILVTRLPDEKAEAARRRLRKTARKKGRTLDPQSLEMAAYVLLLTNLPQASWPIAQVFRLYRLRWQIEWVFRRWKQFLTLEGSPARNEGLSQAVLLAKVVGLLLTEQLSGQALQECPEWLTSPQRPLNPARILQLYVQQLKTILWGPLTLDQIRKAMPQLDRYLCDGPRKRGYPLAEARQWLASLPAPAPSPLP